MICPLCSHNTGSLFFTDKWRSYYQCSFCSLLFVPGNALLDPDTEKCRYLEHTNSHDDTRYIEFLSKSLLPLLNIASSKSSILDYGSGPVPVLASLIADLGLSIDAYDPFFCNDRSYLSKQYDIIVSTEVFEHIIDISKTIYLLSDLLKTDGWLIIQTSFYPQLSSFKGWNYKNDPTHIRFFSYHTFLWIADMLHCSVSFPEKNVAVLKKTGL